MSASDGEHGFEEWLHATFGPLPALDLGPLLQVAPTAWATAGCGSALPIVPAFRQTPGDYAMAGHWGRGGSSDAVYLIERRGACRAFLRLPWGGPYGDAARDVARVREALTAWAAARRVAVERLAACEVVSNMQNDRASLRWPDGREQELLGPTPLAPDRPPFWPALLAAISA